MVKTSHLTNEVDLMLLLDTLTLQDCKTPSYVNIVFSPPVFKLKVALRGSKEGIYIMKVDFR